MSRKKLAECIGFDWDEGNIEKNWINHRILIRECEEVFSNRPLLLADDKKHSETESRYHVLGRTDQNRLLFIAFTIRHPLIRVISARDMNQKERRRYHEKIKRDAKI